MKDQDSVEYQRTMSQLIEEVGSWATRNFVNHAPVLGILEEIGEVGHGVLKHLQGIRGFDDEKKFVSHLVDGFADAAIYLCHCAYSHRAFFAFKRNCVGVTVPPDRVEYHIISQVLQSLAALMNQEARDFGSDESKQEAINLYNVFCQRMCNALELWAASYSIDLEAVTFATWKRIVSKRDWVEDAVEGGGHKHD